MGADEEPAKSDMHHLFPTKDNVNSSRSNCPFDDIPDEETDTWYWTDQSSTSIPADDIDAWSEKDNDHPDVRFDCRFEPREDHKGNAARAIFYFATIYPERVDSDFFDVQKSVLREWHELDPPTEAERARSDAIALHQDTPNPFVIDTTLVRRAFFEGTAGGFEQVVYTFDANDECPTTDDGPTQAPEQASFTEFTRAGVECNNAAGVFNSSDWPASRSEDYYVEFYGNAPMDAALAFSEGATISFVTRRSGTGPTDGELMYQARGDEFASLGTWTLADTDEHELSFSLAEVGQTWDVRFRFYGWGSTSDRGTLRFDDVQLSFGIVGTDAETEDELPSGFELLSAFPNPFNPSATIRVHVDRSQQIRLEVYDVLGRRVRILHEGLFTAGRHEISFDAGGLPGGTYFIRAVGSHDIATRAISLLK